MAKRTTPITSSPTTQESATATAEEEEIKVLPHRILVSDTDDPLNPQVAPLIILASTRAEAIIIVERLQQPLTCALPPGSHRTQCRLEEALPFARDGFGIRRNTWNINEVALIHPGICTRIDLYLRNPQQPAHAPTHIRDLIKGFSAADILSEDWLVCARPPTFGNRR